MRWKNRAGPMIGAALSMLLAKDAYAYIDPGTGSMILQAVIGGIAMGFVVLRLWWHKIKAACTRMIGRAPKVGAPGNAGGTGFDSERRR